MIWTYFNELEETNLAAESDIVDALSHDASDLNAEDLDVVLRKWYDAGHRYVYDHHFLSHCFNVSRMKDSKDLIESISKVDDLLHAYAKGEMTIEEYVIEHNSKARIPARHSVEDDLFDELLFELDPPYETWHQYDYASATALATYVEEIKSGKRVNDPPSSLEDMVIALAESYDPTLNSSLEFETQTRDCLFEELGEEVYDYYMNGIGECPHKESVDQILDSLLDADEYTKPSINTLVSEVVNPDVERARVNAEFDAYEENESEEDSDKRYAVAGRVMRSYKEIYDRVCATESNRQMTPSEMRVLATSLYMVEASKRSMDVEYKD